MHIHEWTAAIENGRFDGELDRLYAGGAQAQRRRYTRLLSVFEESFGDRDAVVVSAPGRTELAGNHTDHQNGKVLCAAVTLDTLAVASAAEDRSVRIRSEGFDEIRLVLDDLAPHAEETGSSEGLVRGVAAGFARRGLKIGGLRAVLTSEVPVGGGLSSSAALEVLIGALFSHIYNNGAADALTLAMVGQEAERNYFGKPSGLMDQAASAFGGITMIDFGTPGHPEVDRLDFDFRENGYVLCAVDARTSHADLTDDYAAIPGEMRSVAAYFGREVLREVPEAEFNAPAARAALAGRVSARAILRAEHYYAENARVPLMADALKRGDMAAYVALMNASGESSRDKLQNVVPSLHPEERSMALALDRAGELLRGKGAWRIHGGGFAGCIQCLVPAADFPAFREAMDAFYGPGSCWEMRIRPCGPHALGNEL